jgi:hypothetical protein
MHDSQSYVRAVYGHQPRWTRKTRMIVLTRTSSNFLDRDRKFAVVTRLPESCNSRIWTSVSRTRNQVWLCWRGLARIYPTDLDRKFGASQTQVTAPNQRSLLSSQPLAWHDRPMLSKIPCFSWFFSPCRQLAGLLWWGIDDPSQGL